MLFKHNLTQNHFSGSRSRKFPMPNKNPFTWLFLFVSCPNYTYEVIESIYSHSKWQFISPMLYIYLSVCLYISHILQVGAWVSFSIMTQCLPGMHSVFCCVGINTPHQQHSNICMCCIPVALYTLLGFIQMTIWAKGKHRAYSREFKDYPSLRMAIIPLIL